MISEIQSICDLVKGKKFTTSVLLTQLNQSGGKLGTNWLRVYRLAEELGLIRKIDRDTAITEAGFVFFSMSKTLSSITEEQRKFIFESSVLGNKKLKDVNEFLNNFRHDGDFIFKIFGNEIEEKGILTDGDMFALLEELDVIEWNVDDKCWCMKEKFSKNFNKHNIRRDVDSRNLKNNSVLSQDKFEETEEEKIRIGDIGEDLALKYERKMLKDKGWTIQVQEFDHWNSKENLVAKQNLHAGYDISSFKTKTSSVVDKYIEVKSRKYGNKSFIIGEGEILAGKQYSKEKKSYFIYFYHNLEKEKPDKPTKIIPFEYLDINLCKKCPELIDPHYNVDLKKFFN